LLLEHELRDISAGSLRMTAKRSSVDGGVGGGELVGAGVMARMGRMGSLKVRFDGAVCLWLQSIRQFTTFG
jgi:hypothetical protein